MQTTFYNTLYVRQKKNLTYNSEHKRSDRSDNSHKIVLVKWNNTFIHTIILMLMMTKIINTV